MTPVATRRPARRFIPLPVFDVLALIPEDGSISEPALTAAAAADGARLIDGKLQGLRSLRRAGAAICTRDTDPIMWTRTNKGTRLLRAHLHPSLTTTTPKDPS